MVLMKSIGIKTYPPDSAAGSKEIASYLRCGAILLTKPNCLTTDQAIIPFTNKNILNLPCLAGKKSIKTALSVNFNCAGFLKTP